MEISEILQRTGLNEKETKVYLALLELGNATGYSVAQKAELKHPITYVILDSLQKQGLITQVPHGNKIIFTPESPEKLLSEANKKSELLKRGMPEMLAIYNTKTEKPQVRLYYGKNGVKEIYQKVFQAQEAYFFGTTTETIKIYPDSIKDFAEAFRKTNLQVKDIITKSSQDIKFASLFKNESRYQIRFMKPEMKAFSDFAVFDDNVAFFSFRPEIFALLVTSKGISSLLRNIYEMAWASAETL